MPLLVGVLGPNLPVLELLFALEFGIVKSAGVAERPCAVGSAPPFGSVNTVATVAPARWCSSAPLLDFVEGKGLLDRLIVHGHVHLVVAGRLLSVCVGRGAFADNRLLDHAAQVLQHRLEPLSIADHFNNLAVTGHASRHRLRAMLFSCNATKCFRKVEHGSGVASNPCKIFCIAPGLKMSVDSAVVPRPRSVEVLRRVLHRVGVLLVWRRQS